MGYRLKVIGVLLALSVSVFAVDYTSTGSTTEQTVQLRTGAEFAKKWKCGVKLGIEQEFRFNLYDVEKGVLAKDQAVVDTSYGASFNKSYTTLSLSYAHPQFPYLRADAGYTLRILGNKGYSDPNKFIRHRVFFGVTGSYKTDLAKIYLRERFVCDMRTDSVNPDEKSKYAWSLRSRLGTEFIVPGKPVKPYLWGEVENTLNAPEFQQKNGQQFICNVRAQAGVKWRITRLSSLDFFYRFQYGYNRDINVNSNYYSGKSLKLRLDEEKSFVHAIGIVYNLDW